ncbi:hypothetical protein HHK36_027614 [Tetracentron sinense]|uniref:Protein ABIL1 n=1 Tax=Tetracentron sinense TaxID=13715 RepID=A0A834YHU0_TETSI|nr:hypothetical protein HHK36_027614 [Tetracentron sinense]
MQQLRPENPSMAFDEVSMERSKSFVKALQELKNLRPQLYSAAEYCEKSYLLSEQKQMVLDNLKDYAVRALVNAVDHLGTVAYKLTDLFEQQTLDVSTMELKILCLNQQLLTGQKYMDEEGLRQQQLLAFIPRHHKHYILPNSVNKKVHFSPQIQIDAWQKHMQARPRRHPSGIPASKTLSWHLASETKSTLDGTSFALMSTEDPKASGTTSGVFHLLGMPNQSAFSIVLSCQFSLVSIHGCKDAEEAGQSKSSAAHLRSVSGSPASSAFLQTFGVTRRNYSECSKPLTAFRSFDNPSRREIVHAPVRSKSMLAAFVKHKTSKPKSGYLS